MNRFAFAALWVFVASPSRLAWADAVDVSVKGRALIGQGVPSLELNIVERIMGFRLKLKRSDGKVFDLKGGGAPGQMREVMLDQPEGAFHYEGEVIANFPNGTSSSMPLQFDTELLGPLRLKMEKEDVEVPSRKLKFRLSRPAGKAHVVVTMDTGRTALDEDIAFHGEAAGTPLEVSWPEAPGTVMKINIKAYDTSTFFTGVEVFPWQVDIPHEEVHFDSGKWDVLPAEQEKLEKSYSAISEAASKFGRLAEIKLYIAGHTDTVGSSASNRALSLNRAKSIGAFLRRRGVRLPILYEGFGEEALLVGTPDETDEPRNRRAEYIIAVENPSLKRSPFVPRWQRL